MSLFLQASLFCRASNFDCRVSINCRSSVQERSPPGIKSDRCRAKAAPESGGRSAIPVHRQRYVSASKSDLLDAIVDAMFPSREEAREFRYLSHCLDSIIHAEHKSILDEMSADLDVPLTTKARRTSTDDVADELYRASINGSSKVGSLVELREGNAGSEISNSSYFDFNWSVLSDFLLKSKGSPLRNSRVVIPGRFQHDFMKLLHIAGFEELSSEDLMLTAELNNDYLLTLPIYVDWKRAAESSAIVFRRGYTTEQQKGLLIAEKLDYLQAKLLQKLFSLVSKPLGRFGMWFNEAMMRIIQENNAEDLADKLKFWMKEFSVSVKTNSCSVFSPDDSKTADIPPPTDHIIWAAAQRAVTRYEGILSEVGPRERLLRRFLAWIGQASSSAPEHAFDINDENSSSETNSTSENQSFLSRISLADVWKPASFKSCGNDLKEMFRRAISILFSESILQEPAFEELILLYAERDGLDGTPSLRMKIYEGIPIPDLPVVFPHKKLSFRILDTVRLDFATILGLLAYFFSYKFEDILSSPSAVVLDVIAASGLVVYVTRVLLGYKQTRDRYELLVNRTLNERSVASGFGCIHFLLDASEQQQYKETILVYAILLKANNGQLRSVREIAEKCEAFVYSMFQEKVEMRVDRAVETLLRLGILVEMAPLQCSRACAILRKHWNTLI